MRKALFIITLYFFPLIAQEVQECEEFKRRREYVAGVYLSQSMYANYVSTKRSLEDAFLYKGKRSEKFSKILTSQAQVLKTIFDYPYQNESEEEKQAKSRILDLLNQEAECYAKEGK